jgi:hypothetical protein
MDTKEIERHIGKAIDVCSHDRAGAQMWAQIALAEATLALVERWDKSVDSQGMLYVNVRATVE